MIQAQDITVVLPGVFPDNSHWWMMETTCKRFGIKPILYGMGEVYAGWLDILFYRLHEAVKKVETSHVLISDARDAFFLADLDEIATKHNRLRCPDIFASSYFAGGKFEIAYGGFLCKTEALLSAFQWMQENLPAGAGDVPILWEVFMQAHPEAVTLDTNSRIFLNVGHDSPEAHYQVDETRVTTANTTPCLIHFNGGYSDPITGKWFLMESLWRQLGYTENPPWLEVNCG